MGDTKKLNEKGLRKYTSTNPVPTTGGTVAVNLLCQERIRKNRPKYIFWVPDARVRSLSELISQRKVKSYNNNVGKNGGHVEA